MTQLDITRTRVDRARAEINRRRASLEREGFIPVSLILHALGEQWEHDARDPLSTRPPVYCDARAETYHAAAEVVEELCTAMRPTWARQVLFAAEQTLQRHQPSASSPCPCSACPYQWPCPDAAEVLDLYAPQTVVVLP